MQKNKTAIWIPARKKQGMGHYYRNKWIVEKSEVCSYFFNEELEYSIEESKEIFLSDDPSTIEKFLLSGNYHCLFVDHYFLSEEIKTYFLKRRNIKVVWFDYDFSAPKFDALINSNIFARVEVYEKLPADIKVFLGEGYYGFRKEFYQIQKIKKVEDNIFISFGGSDVSKLTLDILEKIDKKLTYHVCLGRGCSQEYVAEVKLKFLNLNLSGEVYFDSKNYLKILSTCSGAILTSSTSTYEAEFFGIPYVVFNVVDNQAILANYLKNKGIAVLTSVKDFQMSDTRHEFKKLGICFSSSCDQLLSYLETI